MNSNASATTDTNLKVSETESSTKMESKSVNEESEDLLKGGADDDEEKPTEEKEQVKEKEATESAAAALTSLHESKDAPNEEKEKDKDEEDGEDEDDDEPRDDSDFIIPLKLTKSGRKRATPFPLKLMKVLSNKEFTDIVAWTPSGKAFNILQPKLFTANILPDYFKSAKYSSFTRKLHRWGFMRHYRGPEAGAFFHKNFRRGRMDLVEKMTCSKPGGGGAPSKVSGARAAANANDNAPAMSMLLDTSASSRDSIGYRGNHANMMALGLPQLPAGAGFNALMQQQQMGGMGVIPQQFLMQGFGGMPTTAAQQQMLLQQQQQLQQQHMVAQQPQQQGGGNPSGDANLDAAIELEVTRRLKERINAAAFSRQAMSMMPQQGAAGQSPGQMPQAAAQGQLQQHQNMMQQSMMGGRAMFATGGAGGMGSSSIQGFPPGFKGFDHNQAAFMNVQDPFGMPSNIQGAKTA